jgi:glyceraldehyde-3-phosphate dehydrogenase (NADP+) (phosphorylating)
VTVSAKKVRVAINGFGRIGRQFLRCWEGRTDSNLEVVAVNDSGGVKQASHLLKYDSTMGTFDAEVKVRRRTAVEQGRGAEIGSTARRSRAP